MKCEPRVILKSFLNLWDFELQYSYKPYSFKKGVYTAFIITRFFLYGTYLKA